MTTNMNDEALVLHHVRLMAETLKETKKVLDYLRDKTRESTSLGTLG